MKAIVRYKYGSPDVLELRDIDKPEIEDDEVLVYAHAAGVDRGVWHLMTGLPYPIRLAGYGLRAPTNPVIGSDVAGVVEAVGKNVSRFEPGDEVFGIGKGPYAEYARALEDKLAHKPSNLTFEQAAVVAISGLTALQGLRDHGQIEPGQEALIIGALLAAVTLPVTVASAPALSPVAGRGLRNAKIAEEPGCHPKTVRERIHRFNANGIDGLGDRPRTGRRPRITELERSKIIALVAKNPPGKLLTEPDGVLRAEDETKAAYWTLDALVETAREIGIEISRSQVRLPLPPGGGGFTELGRLLFPQLSAAHFRLSAGKPEFI
jgi:transposase